MSSPLRRPLSFIDRNRLGPKDDIAEHVGLRRIQGIAYREAGIPPIASEGVVHGCDLPGLHDGKRHVISRRDGQPFGVARIWENWRDPLTDKWERTFAVVTVPANELVAQIHDRMLAILPNDLFARWLSDEADPRELLVPFPADQLAVSPQRSRR